MSSIAGQRAEPLPGAPELDEERQPLPAWDGLVAAGVALAVLAGLLAGYGHWWVAALLVLGPAFLVLAVAAPTRMALALLVALPLMVYPARVGEFSVFLAVPLFGVTSIALVLGERATLHRLREILPLRTFAVLVVTALIAAALSSDVARGSSRVLYLVLYGVLAWALATALLTRRLTAQQVATALVWGGAVGATAVMAQFFAQFAFGQQSVIDWMQSVYPAFGGQRAAEINQATSNWVVSDPEVLRGLFPFMSPSSAGQYLMMSLIAGLWLLRERWPLRRAGAALLIGLIALIGVGLLVSLSRQAWVGLLAGVLVVGLRSRRVRRILAVAAVLALVVPIPGRGGTFGTYLLSAAETSSTSSGTRLQLWGDALELMPEHALVGVGPGLYDTLNPVPGRGVYYAHNIFLDAGVEIGLLGLVALVLLFALALRTAWRRGATLALAMLTAYVVANLFDDLLYFPRNGLLLAVAVALLAAPSRSDGGSPTPHRRPSAATVVEP